MMANRRRRQQGRAPVEKRGAGETPDDAIGGARLAGTKETRTAAQTRTTAW